MTWGEFKKIVESQGVVDSVEVEYIDKMSWADSRWIKVDFFNERKRVQIIYHESHERKGVST